MGKKINIIKHSITVLFACYSLSASSQSFINNNGVPSFVGDSLFVNMYNSSPDTPDTILLTYNCSTTFTCSTIYYCVAELASNSTNPLNNNRNEKNYLFAVIDNSKKRFYPEY